jgi:NAD(P)-dependent dehydrogenase (short-subunit alcohol dehydrogenase family)
MARAKYPRAQQMSIIKRADQRVTGDRSGALIATTIATYGRLDCAHNNAGIEGVETLTADHPEADWDRVISIFVQRVTSLWTLTQFTHEIQGRGEKHEDPAWGAYRVLYLTSQNMCPAPKETLLHRGR